MERRVNPRWGPDRAGVDVNKARDSRLISDALDKARHTGDDDAANLATRRIPDHSPESLYFSRNEIPTVVRALGSLAGEVGLRTYFRRRRIRSLIADLVITEQTLYQ